MTTYTYISSITLILAMTMLTVCAYTDMRDRKVLNIITFPMMAIGLILSSFVSLELLFLRFLCLLLFFLFGMMRIMGMGDLKLLMALTALRGIYETTYTMFFAALLLIIYCAMERPKETALVMKDTAMFLAVRRKIKTRSETRYPFAVFIAIAYPIGYFLCNGF